MVKVESPGNQPLLGVLWEESKGPAASGKCAEERPAGQDCTCSPSPPPRHSSLPWSTWCLQMPRLSSSIPASCIHLRHRVPTTATVSRLNCWVKGKRVLFNALQMSISSFPCLLKLCFLQGDNVPSFQRWTMISFLIQVQ